MVYNKSHQGVWSQWAGPDGFWSTSLSSRCFSPTISSVRHVFRSRDSVGPNSTWGNTKEVSYCMFQNDSHGVGISASSASDTFSFSPTTKTDGYYSRAPEAKENNNGFCSWITDGFYANNSGYTYANSGGSIGITACCFSPTSGSWGYSFRSTPSMSWWSGFIERQPGGGIEWVRGNEPPDEAKSCGFSPALLFNQLS